MSGLKSNTSIKQVALLGIVPQALVARITSLLSLKSLTLSGEAFDAFRKSAEPNLVALDELTLIGVNREDLRGVLGVRVITEYLDCVVGSGYDSSFASELAEADWGLRMVTYSSCDSITQEEADVANAKSGMVVQVVQ